METTRKANVTLRRKPANPATAKQFRYLELLCDDDDILCSISQWMQRMPASVASALINRKQAGQKIIIN